MGKKIVDACGPKLEKLRHVFSIAYVRFVISMITVEPTLFFFSAGMEVLGLARQNGLYWKICEQKFGGRAGVNCYEKTHGMMTKRMREDVQVEVATWGVYMSLAHQIPVLLVAPIFGAFSDKHGRKTVILLATIGVILMEVVFIAEMTWVWLPIWILPLCSFLTTFTGFYGTFQSSCYAYVADREQDKARLTMRFAWIQVASSLATTIMGFSVAHVIERMRYTQIPIISISLTVVSFAYSLTFLREVPPKVLLEEQKKQAAAKDAELQMVEKGKNTETMPAPQVEVAEKKPVKITKERHPLAVWSLTKDCVKTALKPREGHFRAYIWLLLFTFFFTILTTHAQGHILHLFMLGDPLNWSIKQQSIYNGFTSLIRLLGVPVSASIFKALGLHETTILLIAGTSVAAKMLLLGSIQTTATMYIASVLGFAGFLGMFVSKSLVSQFVPNDEIGKVFALFQLVGDIAQLAGSYALQGIYIATLRVFPGAVFFICAGAKVCTLLVILGIHIDYKRYRARKAAEGKPVIEQPVVPAVVLQPNDETEFS